MSNQSPKKRNAVITTSVNETTGEMVLTFPTIGTALHINPADLDPIIVQQATYHGLKQKLVDAAAIGRDPDTGKSATDRDKFEAVSAVLNRLKSGEWNLPREGGGGGSLLQRALVALSDGKKTAEDIATWLAGKSDAEKRALRANPKVAAKIAELQKVDESIDTDEMLGDLMD